MLVYKINDFDKFVINMKIKEYIKGNHHTTCISIVRFHRLKVQIGLCMISISYSHSFLFFFNLLERNKIIFTFKRRTIKRNWIHCKIIKLNVLGRVRVYESGIKRNCFRFNIEKWFTSNVSPLMVTS